MSKEIPEEVYNSIEILAKYCQSYSFCKHCPFAYKPKDDAKRFFCKLDSEFRASEWTDFIMKTEKTGTTQKIINGVVVNVPNTSYEVI